jgi:hypothetical protein
MRTHGSYPSTSLRRGEVVEGDEIRLAHGMSDEMELEFLTQP